MGRITIIRGLPGSGKTTLAKYMVDNGEADYYIETDMWFTGPDGVYRFDREKLPEYHKSCQDAVRLAADLGHHVVVSNTFVRKWEVEPYLNMGHPVSVIVADGEYQSVHGVPKSSIDSMKIRWETL